MAAKYVEAPLGDSRILLRLQGKRGQEPSPQNKKEPTKNGDPNQKKETHVFYGKESENRIEFLDGNGKFHVETA